MRIFVAINLPKYFSTQLDEELQTVKQEHKDYRWVYTENMHITLAFLGELDDYGLSILEKVVEKTIEKIKKSTFTTGKMIDIPIGVYRDKYYGFVRQKKVNGIALSIEKGIEEIKAISEIIENFLVEIGKNNNYEFRTKEKRPFIPHITLARKGRNPMRYLSYHYKNESFSIQGFIDNITIFKSEIFKGNPNRQHKEIPKYTPIKIYKIE